MKSPSPARKSWPPHGCCNPDTTQLQKHKELLSWRNLNYETSNTCKQCENDQLQKGITEKHIELALPSLLGYHFDSDRVQPQIELGRCNSTACPSFSKTNTPETPETENTFQTHLRSCKSVDKLLHHHCSLANCMGLIDCRSLLGSCFCLLRPRWQTNACLNARKRKHQCHKGEREQTACLQAFSSESAPTILSATNLSSRNQVIISNLVDMIIDASLMNCVGSFQCTPGVPAESDGKSLGKWGTAWPHLGHDRPSKNMDGVQNWC